MVVTWRAPFLTCFTSMIFWGEGVGRVYLIAWLATWWWSKNMVIFCDVVPLSTKIMMVELRAFLWICSTAREKWVWMIEILGFGGLADFISAWRLGILMNLSQKMLRKGRLFSAERCSGILGCWLMFLEENGTWTNNFRTETERNFETHGRKRAPIGAMMITFPMLTSPATGQQNRDEIRSQTESRRQIVCGGVPMFHTFSMKHMTSKNKVWDTGCLDC